MSDRDKKEERGLEQLTQLQPPDWIAEMQKYYRKYGAYRVEDVARLLGRRAGAEGSLAQSPKQTTTELLQQMASKRR